ncbi:MAG: translocation/assembly module TamB domain-containing protein [Acidobacteriota bacterium]|jgi:outer membrane protein assembly factor BamA
MNGPDAVTAGRPEPAPPTRPHAGRRWLRRLLWALGLLSVLFALLHTPPAKRVLTSALVSLASRALGAEVRVDRFDYRLWAGEVRLDGVDVRRPRLEITCARAEVKVGLDAGVRARIEAPRVVVTQGPPGDDRPPSGPSRPWTTLAWVDAVDLREGALELRNREDVPWLRLEGFEVQVESPSGHPRGSVRVAEAGVGWPGAGIRVEPLRAEGEFELERDSGAVRLLRGEVVAGESTFEGRGHLAQVQPIEARAEGGGRLDARLLQQLVPDLEIEGWVDARATFEKDAAGARGSLEVEAADLRVFEVGPWDGTIRGRLEDRRLHVESLDLAGYDGRAEASGTVFLGDGPSTMDARAHDLDVETLVGTFVDAPPPLASRVDARLELEIRDWEVDTLEGRGGVVLRAAEGEGWPVTGPVQVSLAERRVSFAAEDLRVRSAEVTAEGSFTFTKDLNLRYALRVPGLEGAPELLADAAVDVPELALGGSVEVEGEIEGRLPEWQGTARIASGGVSVEDVDVGLEGVLAMSGAGVEIESFEAKGEDGSLSVAGFIPFDDAGSWSVDAKVAKLRLTDALGLHGVPAPAHARGWARVEGPRGDPTVEYEVEARVEPSHSESGAGATDSESAASVNESEDRSLAKGGAPDGTPPAREPAVFHLAGSASRRGVVVEELTGVVGGGAAEASGTWIRDGEVLDVRARVADVQLARLPWLPGPAALGELSSTLTGEADLSGRLDAPEGRLGLLLADSSYREQTLGDLTFEAVLDGTQARLDGRIGGERLLSGLLRFEKQWPLHVDLELAALPLTQVAQALPGVGGAERNLAVTGTASLDVPLCQMTQLEYESRVDSLEVDLGGEGSSAGPFTVSGTREAVSIRGLALRGGEGRLEVDGGLGLASETSSPLTVHGEIPLAELAAFLPDTELTGKAVADVRIGGRLAAPDITGELRVAGEAGRVGPLALEAMELEATAREGVLTVQRSSVEVAGGEISVRGSLPIGPQAEGTQTLEFRLQGVDPGLLLEATPGDPRLVAPLDMSGQLRVAAPALDAMEAEGEITGWSVNAGKETLVLEKPVAWQYREGRLTIRDLRLRGSQGHLGLDGTWAPDGGGQVRLSGETDLALLDPLLGGGLLLSGPGRVDLTVSGNVDDLALEGGASLENARAVLREPPLVVSDLTGSLEARGRTIGIDARGTVGDGTLRVNGRVGVAPTGPEVDVTLDAERVPLTFPEGLRSRSSGKVRLSGREHRYRVDGDVTVHRAVYDRETDFTNQSLDSVGAELKALEERGSLLERVQLDVRVRLSEGLRIQNRQVQVVLDGAVTLGGDLLMPELRGSVSLRDGGTIRLSRATVRLVDGRINLAGFPTQPLEVDVSGRTQVTGIHVDIDLSGPLDDLRTSLSSPSRSDLTQADLATLLLTGRTAQAAADESGAIVAEEVAATLGSALNERLGGAVLIDVSRDESLIVQDTDPTQRFNIGIPIAERLYVIHSQALDRSGVRWILDFRPTGKFRVRLISDSDDTGAIEISHGLDFNLWSRARHTPQEEDERPRVREVRVEGLSGADAAELEKKAKLQAGDRYDFFEGDKSARRMQELLVGQGYRTALVEAAEKPADEGRVDVVFRVERGPRVEVEWAGDDPGRKLRKRFGETWDAYLSLEETAARRARDLRNELRARRYYQATVSAKAEGSETDARVVFDVKRGPRGQGVDLVFEGNDSLPAQSLAAVLPPPKEAAFFALIEPGGASRLDTALRTAGARAGFLSLTVGAPRESLDPATDRLRVTIPIDEGERAAVARLELPEEVTSLTEASPPKLQLQVGEPFRIDAYVNDRGTLASWFRTQGFPEARLAGILDPVPEGMAVRFEVDTGPRPRVGQIRQARAGVVRSSVVNDALTLGPGDLIRPDDLALSRDHLSETRVFRSVDIRAETTDDAEVRDLVVDLAARPDLNVEYKIRYETGRRRETVEEASTEESRGFQFGAGIEAANPFGRANRYSVYGLAGTRRQLFGATFEALTVFGRRWRTQVFVFDDNEKDYETSGITRRISSVAVQQTKRWRSGLSGRRWHDRLRMLWGYAFRRIDYVDPTTGETAGGYRAGVSTSLIGDTRNSVTDPHRGLFWTVTGEPALEAMGSDKNYVKLYGQIFAYVPLGEKVVWAQALRIGAAPGDDPLLLLDRRFKAGGATTVRGFSENGLGPQHRDVSIGGQGLFVFNQELRFPIWGRIQAGVFFDTGNVWELASELDLRDLRSNVGGGLRVMFPFGPVRLDWAWVLDPREGEQRSRWQLALGHAF